MKRYLLFMSMIAGMHIPLCAQHKVHARPAHTVVALIGASLILAQEVGAPVSTALYQPVEIISQAEEFNLSELAPHSSYCYLQNNPSLNKLVVDQNAVVHDEYRMLNIGKIICVAFGVAAFVSLCFPT